MKDPDRRQEGILADASLEVSDAQVNLLYLLLQKLWQKRFIFFLNLTVKNFRHPLRTHSPYMKSAD